MIDEIREQARFIQEQLWEIAEKMGFLRTQETVFRIHKTFQNILYGDGVKNDLHPYGDYDEQLDSIDSMLTLAFISASLAEVEKSPAKSLKALVTSAESLGMLDYRCRVMPDGGAVDDGSHDCKLASASASILAKLRHANNYALVAEALEYWGKNIDPGLSAAKAANVLVRVVPLSHKKLSEVISGAKKGAGKS